MKWICSLPFLFVLYPRAKIFMSREGEAASKGGKREYYELSGANWKRVDLGMQC